MRPVLFVFACSLAACKSSSGADEDDFPECDTDAEAKFVDGIGLGFISVDVLRSHVMGETRYDLIVHGDDPEITQFIIVFSGMPIEGMEYEITTAEVADQPVLSLYPPTQAPELVAGTMTFTQLATENGEILMADLRFELTTGVLEGCIRATLSASTDGSDTGDTSGGSSGDSTG